MLVASYKRKNQCQFKYFFFLPQPTLDKNGLNESSTLSALESAKKAAGPVKSDSPKKETVPVKSPPKPVYGNINGTYKSYEIGLMITNGSINQSMNPVSVSQFNTV